jgi:intracellular sulfur oxidation DsrE/DsrF family protein
MKLLNATLGALMIALVSTAAFAQGGNTECPVGLVTGKTLDAEFGPGTQNLTKCIEKRSQVKMVVQINQLGTATRPYALGNIENIIADYETTHGMVRGRDYEIVAVIHSGGGFMALKNDGYNGSGQWVTGRNPAQGKVEELMEKGVKFYFCQNTTRAYLGTHLPAGDATAQLIPGMLYTTAGLTSIADFQAAGYQYIQP